MRKTRWIVSLAGLVSLAGVLAGCGSTAAPDDPTLPPGPTDPFGAKYVETPGGVEEKEFPGLAAPADSRLLDTPLPLGDAPLEENVPRDRVNWFSFLLAPADVDTAEEAATPRVVLMRPSPLEDSDLFVFRPYADLSRAGTSTRAGNRIDWVAVTPGVGGSGRYQVAVYGFSPTTAADPNDFRIEVDAARRLIPGAAAVAGAEVATGSDWFRISATAGTSYTVTLHPTSGDPDLTVYEEVSHSLVGQSQKTTGDDVVAFRAHRDGTHFIRVFGVNATRYTIRVQ